MHWRTWYFWLNLFVPPLINWSLLDFFQGKRFWTHQHKILFQPFFSLWFIISLVCSTWILFCSHCFVISTVPGMPEVRVVHHQDVNKRILIALVVASTLLGGILLFLSCLWIWRQKDLKNLDRKSQQSLDATKRLSWGPILGKFNSLRARYRCIGWCFGNYSTSWCS